MEIRKLARIPALELKKANVLATCKIVFWKAFRKSEEQTKRKSSSWRQTTLWQGTLRWKAINKLENNFGGAVRLNTHLLEMKKAMWAVVYHCSEASNARNMFCGKELTTCCKYLAAKIHGTQYTNKHGLRKIVREAIIVREVRMQIFQE